MQHERYGGQDRASRRFIPGGKSTIRSDIYRKPGAARDGAAAPAYVQPMKFLDEAKVYVRSGDGGNGCVAFRR
jgi:hypothetical protein